MDPIPDLPVDNRNEIAVIGVIAAGIELKDAARVDNILQRLARRWRVLVPEEGVRVVIVIGWLQMAA
jgi:hypothetical protein